MNNNLRLEDYLRAYADVHEHTILNTQAFEVRMRCKERKPFALVIGRTCGIRIQEIDFSHYHRSMTSLRHSMEQHRTVLLFCLPWRMHRLGVCTDFVRMTPEHYSRYYAMLDPVKIGESYGDVVREKPRQESVNLSPECRKTLRECVDYLNNKCMRTERQKPKHNRCNGHGFQRTFAANELMSRY